MTTLSTFISDKRCRSVAGPTLLPACSNIAPLLLREARRHRVSGDHLRRLRLPNMREAYCRIGGARSILLPRSQCTQKPQTQRVRYLKLPDKSIKNCDLLIRRWSLVRRDHIRSPGYAPFSVVFEWAPQFGHPARYPSQAKQKRICCAPKTENRSTPPGHRDVVCDLEHYR